MYNFRGTNRSLSPEGEYCVDKELDQNLHELDQSLTLHRQFAIEANCPEITEVDEARATVLAGFLSSPRKVLKVGPNIVAKLGPDLDMTEVDSIAFIRNHTTIPVPEVLKAYERNGCRYILMEFIEGQMLDKAWPNLSPSERSIILSQLKDYVRQMRQIRPHKDIRIGSVTGGPAIDRRSFSAIRGGPFISEADFNKWQLEQLNSGTPLLNRHIYTSMHKTNHKIVFSHCDLAFHNIIIRDGRIVAIIDWEDSGWYPEHWDYCKTLSFLSGTDEHYLCCKEIFERQYYDEFFMDMWFTREVKHGGF